MLGHKARHLVRRQRQDGRTAPHTTMPSAAIELDAVDKSYGKRQILKGLRLSVPERSLFAFLGNNGHGKSTTIRLVTGLPHPTAAASGCWAGTSPASDARCWRRWVA